MILKNIEIKNIWYGWVWIINIKWEKKIIVKWVVPNSVVDIKIIKNKKDYKEWKIIKIHCKKDYENVDICKHHIVFHTENNYKAWCGGCKYQVLDYNEQIKLKEKIVKNCFNVIKEEFEKAYLWIVSSPEIFSYRNKIEFSFWKYISQQVKAEWNIGFHKQWFFSKVIDIDSCKFISSKANNVFKYLKKLFKQFWLPVYDNYDHSWFFRHLVIREWFRTDQLLVNLSVATKFFDKKKSFLNKWLNLQDKLLKDKFLKEKITTFLITENNQLADIIKWKNTVTKPLWWWWYIFEKLNIDNIDIKYRVSAFSFFQTNTYWAEKLFTEAVNIIWNNIDWNIADLFCGTWTIWITFLKLGIWNKLRWVEIVEDAIKDAKINAKLNWVETKCKFEVLKSENIALDWKDINLIIVDPPRSWLDKKLIKKIINYNKEKKIKLLYISCNPTTMARDIKLFVEWGFKLKKIKAFDMFPHTHHIEMIWLLE